MIKILFYSSPDFSDNALHLYNYLKSTGDKRFMYIWFVSNTKQFKNDENTIFVSGATPNLNNILKDVNITLASHTSSQYSYKCFNDKHIIVNISHGIGTKGKKIVDKMNEDPLFPGSLFDYIGSLGGDICNKAIVDFNNLPNYDKILPFGYPRNDILIEKHKVKKDITRIIWMPTFKQSPNKNYNEDYFDNETNICLFNTKEDLVNINNWLIRENIKIDLKLHRLQKDLDIYEWINNNLSNIHVMKNSDLCKDFYYSLNDYDGLITDYSSISTDFLLLNKPEGFIFSDIKQYEASRGEFTCDVYKYSPGEHIYTIEQFKSFCMDVKNGIDNYTKERDSVIRDFFKHFDNNASKRYYEFLVNLFFSEDK